MTTFDLDREYLKKRSIQG